MHHSNLHDIKNNIQVDNAQDTDVVTSASNLLKYNDNYYKKQETYFNITETNQL